MADLTLSEAIKEAYGAADTSRPLIDTLSVFYEGLVDDLGNPSELYLFTGANATSIREDGVPLLNAKIEAGAAIKAGEVVEFLGIPFRITLPDVTENPEVVASLAVDNVGREMSDLLAAAATSGHAIYATYRPYLSGSETEGPEADPPIKFTLRNVRAVKGEVTADLVTQTIGNRRFPFETYTPDRFRTLQYG